MRISRSVLESLTTHVARKLQIPTIKDVPVNREKPFLALDYYNRYTLMLVQQGESYFTSGERLTSREMYYHLTGILAGIQKATNLSSIQLQRAKE